LNQKLSGKPAAVHHWPLSWRRRAWPWGWRYSRPVWSERTDLYRRSRSAGPGW